jgi:ppGpp synthetase/RelA/SpoT-type nucleotidyltranferase
VTTFTTAEQARKLAEIQARTKQAWATYSESLRELDGRDYEDAEGESWDRLQRRLRQLDDEKQLLADD